MTAKIGIKYIKEINMKTFQIKTPYVLHRVPAAVILIDIRITDLSYSYHILLLLY